ncbi:venom carboxylesterase-6-like [Thrips palmi]|uniref:Venom carboxylesterase-6-like n=1 Tax=Thrips palmi TaxID=161013 RepID=A0A6P9ABW7_THRPL|nr:venom carboxylesterase-6-like [Thrips palmi]
MTPSKAALLLLLAAAAIAVTSANTDTSVDEYEDGVEEEDDWDEDDDDEWDLSFDDDGEGVNDSVASTPTLPTEAPVLDTWGGRVRGKVLTSAGGRQYFAYLGIPYAEPPVGDLRFKFPRRLKEKAWQGVRECVQDGPKCPQLTYPERQYEGDEDCLYLNIYTHQTQDTSVPVEELVPRLRSVLVWLHGGNFQHGSGSFDDVGPERFMDDNDIVLVVPNYRLNALGFLSVGEHPAVGNAGMKDIFTVLSFVHSHIAEFGGHPGHVTLGGFQAGGAAAHLHALSPLSSSEPNLFQQTLSLSGSALAPWAVLPAAEATRRALKLGRLLGCVKTGVADEHVKAADVVRCLRTKPAEAVVRASERVLDWHSDLSFPFVPSVERFDGHNRPFMITPPEDTLKSGARGLSPKTWVAGVTTHDGLPHALQLMVFRGLLQKLNENFEDTLWDYLGLRHAVQAAGPEWQRNAAQRLRDHYLPGNQSVSLGTLSGLIDLTSDALYNYGLYRTVVLQSAAKRSLSLVYRFGFDRHEDTTRVLGVPLGTDAELVFPAIFANEKSKLTKEEIPVSKKLIRLISNFVTTEDPTPEKEEELDYLEWPVAQGANFSFVEVGLNGKLSMMERDFYSERMALWDSIYEELRSLLAHESEMEEDKKIESTKDEL